MGPRWISGRAGEVVAAEEEEGAGALAYALEVEAMALIGRTTEPKRRTDPVAIDIVV